MTENSERLSPEVRRILEEEAALAEIEVAIDAAFEEGIAVTPKEVIDLLREDKNSSKQEQE